VHIVADTALGLFTAELVRHFNFDGPFHVRDSDAPFSALQATGREYHAL
jgi:hypothetical protein